MRQGTSPASAAILTGLTTGSEKIKGRGEQTPDYAARLML